MADFQDSAGKIQDEGRTSPENNVQRMMRPCQHDTDANLGTFHWPNLGQVEQNNESDSYSSGKLHHLLSPYATYPPVRNPELRHVLDGTATPTL